MSVRQRWPWGSFPHTRPLTLVIVLFSRLETEFPSSQLAPRNWVSESSTDLLHGKIFPAAPTPADNLRELSAGVGCKWGCVCVGGVYLLPAHPSSMLPHGGRATNKLKPGTREKLRSPFLPDMQIYFHLFGVALGIIYSMGERRLL